MTEVNRMWIRSIDVHEVESSGSSWEFRKHSFLSRDNTRAIAGTGWNNEETRAVLCIWGDADVRNQLDGVVRTRSKWIESSSVPVEVDAH